MAVEVWRTVDGGDGGEGGGGGRRIAEGSGEGGGGAITKPSSYSIAGGQMHLTMSRADEIIG